MGKKGKGNDSAPAGTTTHAETNRGEHATSTGERCDVVRAQIMIESGRPFVAPSSPNFIVYSNLSRGSNLALIRSRLDQARKNPRRQTNTRVARRRSLHFSVPLPMAISFSIRSIFIKKYGDSRRGRSTHVELFLPTPMHWRLSRAPSVAAEVNWPLSSETFISRYGSFLSWEPQELFPALFPIPRGFPSRLVPRSALMPRRSCRFTLRGCFFLFFLLGRRQARTPCSYPARSLHVPYTFSCKYCN